jgi:exosortase
MVTRYRAILVSALLGGLLAWAYWPTIQEMIDRWVSDPQYSHGYLVPIFSAVLLWLRRSEIKGETLRPAWWGVGLLAVGLGLWSAGTYFYVPWFAAISLLVCLAGLAATMGGVPALRWSWQAIAFLGFMVPLPYRLHTALGGNLQRFAAKSSTFLLQTFGVPAISEGNLVLVNDVKLGIVEACSGLGMLVTFFALSTGLAILLRSAEWWKRLIIVASAAPVAVAANVVRITVTGMLYNAGQSDLAKVVFHDIAGLLMMPLALAILFWELHVLRRLVVERKAAAPASYGALLKGVR